MQIDFYHWGCQCPYNEENLLVLHEASKMHAVRTHDVADRPELTHRVHMYSPNLTVFDGELRWNGPLSAALIEKAATSTIGMAPFSFEQGIKPCRGELVALTGESAQLAAACCAPRGQACLCDGKAAWVQGMLERFGLPHAGFLHRVDGRCVGGAEFVPSVAVPYPIPKAADTAFLTCSYSSAPVWDYKSYPLETLERELPALGFRSISTVASEEVFFPNGTLQWFLHRGYRDMGLLYREPENHASMHLVVKEL